MKEQEFKTVREFVIHCRKKDRTKEVQYYCWGCKDTTDHLQINNKEEYHCLECGTATFL